MFITQKILQHKAAAVAQTAALPWTNQWKSRPKFFHSNLKTYMFIIRQGELQYIYFFMWAIPPKSNPMIQKN